MNLLLEVAIKNGALFDAIGVIGLGLFGVAAVRLSKRYQSWGGTMMAAGAIALIVARIYYVLAPHFVNFNFLAAIGPVGNFMIELLPPLLLTFGLAGIVWGLWGHERWLSEESR